MELRKYTLSLVLSVFATFLYAQSDTTSIRLYGNVNCKDSLETIAKTFEGITSASYNGTSGRMLIHFSGEFNKDLFVFHFASKGYDAENVRAKDVLYNLLPDACKYSRKPEDVIRD
jgi:hypothetical protein